MLAAIRDGKEKLGTGLEEQQSRERERDSVGRIYRCGNRVCYYKFLDNPLLTALMLVHAGLTPAAIRPLRSAQSGGTGLCVRPPLRGPLTCISGGLPAVVVVVTCSILESKLAMCVWALENETMKVSPSF